MTRGLGQLVYTKRKEAYVYTQGSLTYRNPKAPPSLSPGSLLFKGEGKYGITDIVVYCPMSDDPEHWREWIDNHSHYWRWDGNKEFRDTDVIWREASRTVGIYMFTNDISIDIPNAQAIFRRKTRLRPASGANEKLRLCMTTACRGDLYKSENDPSIEYKPGFVVIANQAGGRTVTKKFKPKYKKVLEGYHWTIPDPTEDDVCLTITFGPKGELVSIE